MSLESFITTIKQSGLPLGSHFLVEFNRNDNPTIQMLTDQVNLPGINIMTTEMRTFGEIQESAYGVIYNPVTVSILLDNKGGALEYIHEWMDAVYDREARYAGYRKDYIADMRLTLLDRTDGEVYQYVLEGAYPKSIGDVQLDYASHEPIRVQVTFAYARWTTRKSVAKSLSRSDVTGPFMPNELFSNSGRSSGIYVDNQMALMDWGKTKDIPSRLSSFSNNMSSSIGRSIASVNRSIVDAAGNPIPIVGADGSDTNSSWKDTLNGMTSNFVRMGEGLNDLSQSLNSVVAPVQTIAQAVGSVSGTLGAMDSTLNALGLGSPFTKIRQNLTQTSGALSTVANLKGVPGHLNTVGANMGAMGGVFKSISGSIDKATNAPAQMSSALNKLGFNLERQGSNLVNGSGNLNDYADT